MIPLQFPTRFPVWQIPPRHTPDRHTVGRQAAGRQAVGRKTMRHQTGVSLTEVLVTVVVLSVGLLGLSGLQLGSMQATNSAAQRYEATLLAEEILERMRANHSQAMAGAYDIAIGEAATGSDRADLDLTAWKSRLGVLPDGDGSVLMGTDDRVTITVEWTDALSTAPAGSDDGVVRLRTRL